MKCKITADVLIPPRVVGATQNGDSEAWDLLESLFLPCFIAAQYEKELVKEESRGRKSARRMAARVRAAVWRETVAIINQVRLFRLAGEISRGSVTTENVEKYNSLVPQVMRHLRSIPKKQKLAEVLQSLGLKVCRHCLLVKSSLDAPDNYCSRDCRKHALDRKYFLRRQAQ